MKHPEITCPYCRMGMADALFEDTNGWIHIDVVGTGDAARSFTCTQNWEGLISGRTENGRATFIPEIDGKLNELDSEFHREPTDEWTRENYPFKDWFYAYIEALNWSDVEYEIEGMEFDRSKMTKEALQEAYDAGRSITEVLKTFLVNC